MTNHSTSPSTAASTNASSITTDSVSRWVEGYLRAWETNDPSDIATLFTEDAEYHEAPFDTQWVGRDEIVEGWQGRWDWQQGGWTFEWSVASDDGMVVVITGIGHYMELGDFDNVWTVTFDESGRCTRFEMVNTERS
jgi:hypothetical protein